MNNKQRQIVAEKISSTVRVLELLGFEYKVSNPRNQKQNGNKSPRVVFVDVGRSKPLRVYNGIQGSTWANEPSGKPIPGVRSNEDLYDYLKNTFRA